MGSKRRTPASAPCSPRIKMTDLPDPWRVLGGLADLVPRTVSALGELAVETSHAPATWVLQEEIATALAHELLEAQHEHFKRGVERGHWELADKVERLGAMEAQLSDLRIRFTVLEEQYASARAALERAALRDISNTSDA